MAEYIFNLIIILQHLITSVFGIIGNLLVIIVYKNKLSDNQTITFFILQLAITDLACCLFVIPINCYHELNLGRITSDFMCKLHTFLIIINITYSCLLMTLVAFERCFSILFPFGKVVTKLRAKIIIVILFFFCLGLGLAGCLAVGIYHKVLKMPAAMNLTVEKNFALETSDQNSDNQPNRYYEEPIDGFIIDNKIAILGKNQTRSNLNQLSQTHYNMSLSFLWMPTYHCFPNDDLIPIDNFHYIQLIQNSIIVACFATIFVLYALICVLVSKRRQLRTNRANYYKEILFRSKQNGMIIMQPVVSNEDSLITREKSGIYEETSLKETKRDLLSKSDNESLKSQEYLKKKSEDEDVNLLKPVIKNHISKSKSLEIEKSISNENILLNVNDIKNKSTQTKSTTIARIKNPDEKLKKKTKVTKNQNDHIQSKSEINMSSSLLANLKTAFMLFVVTLIMMIVYTPALLTSLGYIQYNSIHWNLIYINNAINPVVYSFLNSNFRENLRKTFKKIFNRLFSKNV